LAACGVHRDEPSEDKMPRLEPRRRWRSPIVALAAGLSAIAAPAIAYTAEAAFLTENEAATEKMHRDMHVSPTGDVDRDFVAMMIPQTFVVLSSRAGYRSAQRCREYEHGSVSSQSSERASVIPPGIVVRDASGFHELGAGA
jgi:hypothetical protein